MPCSLCWGRGDHVFRHNCCFMTYDLAETVAHPGEVPWSKSECPEPSRRSTGLQPTGQCRHPPPAAARWSSHPIGQRHLRGRSLAACDRRRAPPRLGHRGPHLARSRHQPPASALAGGIADDWVYLSHPDPPRRTDLKLPGLSITCRVGPGPLPADLTSVPDRSCPDWPYPGWPGSWWRTCPRPGGPLLDARHEPPVNQPSGCHRRARRVRRRRHGPGSADPARADCEPVLPDRGPAGQRAPCRSTGHLVPSPDRLRSAGRSGRGGAPRCWANRAGHPDAGQSRTARTAHATCPRRPSRTNVAAVLRGLLLQLHRGHRVLDRRGSRHRDRRGRTGLSPGRRARRVSDLPSSTTQQ